MELVDTISRILEKKGYEVWSVRPESSVYDAVEVLSTRNIGALLVMESDQLVGIFSERDYARKVVLKGKSSRETSVAEIMIQPVITVTPEHKVEECMKIMTERHIRHLPVIQNQKVVAVVSIGDLVNSIICAQEETIQHLKNYITGGYPQ